MKRKTTRKIHHWLSIVMTLALMFSMVPVMPGKMKVYAAEATALYIKDVPGGGSQLVQEDTTDLQGGWSWDTETSTLTLNEL